MEGAKVVTAPARGTGAQFQTVAIVELSGAATLGKVAAAVEAAATPHKAQCAPGVNAAIPGKLKPTTTPEAILDALKKAGLTAE